MAYGIKMKTREITCLAFISILFLISGCVGGSAKDPTSIAKSLPEVKAFLAQYPNADVITSLYSNSSISANIAQIRSDCGNPDLPITAYWKVQVKEGTTALTIWIDEATRKAVCVVKPSTSGNGTDSGNQNTVNQTGNYTNQTNQTGTNQTQNQANNTNTNQTVTNQTGVTPNQTYQNNTPAIPSANYTILCGSDSSDVDVSTGNTITTSGYQTIKINNITYESSEDTYRINLTVISDSGIHERKTLVLTATNSNNWVNFYYSINYTLSVTGWNEYTTLSKSTVRIRCSPKGHVSYPLTCDNLFHTFNLSRGDMIQTYSGQLITLNNIGLTTTPSGTGYADSFTVKNNTQTESAWIEKGTNATFLNGAIAIQHIDVPDYPIHTLISARCSAAPQVSPNISCPGSVNFNMTMVGSTILTSTNYTILLNSIGATTTPSGTQYAGIFFVTKPDGSSQHLTAVVGQSAGFFNGEVTVTVLKIYYSSALDMSVSCT